MFGEVFIPSRRSNRIWNLKSDAMMKLQWMHFRDRCINYTMKEVTTETSSDRWSEFANLTRALRHLYNHRE